MLTITLITYQKLLQYERETVLHMTNFLPITVRTKYICAWHMLHKLGGKARSAGEDRRAEAS